MAHCPSSRWCDVVLFFGCQSESDHNDPTEWHAHIPISEIYTLSIWEFLYYIILTVNKHNVPSCVCVYVTSCNRCIMFWHASCIPLSAPGLVERITHCQHHFSCCPYRVTVAAAVTLLVCMRNHGIPLLSKLGVDITNHTVECEKNTILKL